MSARGRFFLSVFFIPGILYIISSCALAQNSPGTTPDGKSADQNAAPNAAQSSGAAVTPKPNATQGAAASAAPSTGNAKPPVMGDPNVPFGFRPSVDPKTRRPLYETVEEDWSSLQVGASKLKAEPPLVLPMEEYDKFNRQQAQVQWRPGDPLDLYVVLPKGVKKPPAVLYLYNFSESADRFRNQGWCERVTSGGVAAVGFVSALSADRFHDRPMEQWFVSELQESLGSTVHDVKFILDYLAESGLVDMNHIGMFGQGSGGTIAILAAAADPRIKAVDVLEPWGDWPVFLAKSPVVQLDANNTNFATPASLKKVAPLDPVKWLSTLKIPVRIQQVKENGDTPMAVKERIKAAAPKQAEVNRFEGNMVLGEREGHGHLFDWIKARLQEPAKPGANKAPMAANVSMPPENQSHQTEQH